MQNITERYADMPQLVKDYLYYVEIIKGRSARTCNAYYVDLKSFFRFLKIYKQGEQKPFSEIDISDVTNELITSVSLSDAYEFLRYVSDYRSNEAKTRARKVSSVKGLYKYLTLKAGIIKTDPLATLELPKQKVTLPKYLNLEQCLELLKSVDPSDRFAERNLCMITLFLNCGMRLSELTAINLSHITENRLLLFGKGGKQRIVYLNSSCLSAIERFMRVRTQNIPHVRDDKAMFLSVRGTRITGRAVEYIIDSYFKRSGLEGYGFTVHKLRHTCATLMYQNGKVDIRVLQDLLGHANLGTTEIYTHTSSKQLEDASLLSPLANFGTKQNS